MTNFCTVIIVLLTGCGLACNQNDSKQPIAYNHYLHVEEGGAECLDCHKYAEELARASIPNIENCHECHEEAVSESAAEKTLLAFITSDKMIPWRQIYSIPDHAYFSHRRHVKLGKLECSTCHGDVGNFTVPVSRPFAELTMDWCRDCHEEKDVSNDCYSCHR